MSALTIYARPVLLKVSTLLEKADCPSISEGAEKDDMPASYKVVVTGPFNSGKTTLIGTVSDIEVVRTEKRITTEDRGIKAETTVAMDYGRVALDDRIIHLNGTPGQTRFDFMWDILAKEMDAFVVVVDSTDRHSFADAAEQIRLFVSGPSVPYLVAANKTDLPNRLSLEDVRRGTGISADITVMPCVATQRSSVRQVLLQVIDLIENRPASKP
jgi:small GTP-binding protein